jgi:AcrR family transcriptional regulator
MAKRGPYAKGTVKRNEILDIALDVVSREGYDKTSVREIAREAELSQAGLLHYFSSKEELFVEVLKRREEQRGVEFETSDPVRAMTSIVRHNAETPGLVRLYSTISAESTDAQHPGHAFFAYRYARLRGLLAEGIRGEQERGEFPADLDPEAFATILIAVVDGLQVQWLLDPDQDMAAHISDLWDALARRR